MNTNQKVIYGSITVATLATLLAVLGASDTSSAYTFQKNQAGEFVEVRQVSEVVSVQALLDERNSLVSQMENEQGIADRALGRVKELQSQIDTVNEKIAALVKQYPELEK